MSPLTRRDFLSKSLLASAALLPAAQMLRAQPKTEAGFPLVDLHVHLSNALGIDQAVALAESRGVRFGIVDHPGANTGGFRRIHTDEDLQAYIGELREHPVLVGLQPVYPGWSKPFSAATLDRLDYILMDALTMPDGRGGWNYLWAADTFVEDEELFMEDYTAFIHRLLESERMDVFAWPTYLPVGIAREYRRLWTRPRMQELVDHARERKVAIEINEVARVPDATFINLAKEAGLKFTFGTDARNANAGRFSYCLHMARECGLTASDLFVPTRKA